MLAIVGASIGGLIGGLIDVVTPWADTIMQSINSVLANPSISNNHTLSAMIGTLGVIAAYLLLPAAIGTAGGFFVSKSG